jgi:hypothetical protein
MAYNALTKPIPLGKLAPASGTPIRLTANLVGSLVDPFLPYGNVNSGNDLLVNKLEIKADTGNAGKVYIGFSGLNRATYAGVIRALDPGESWPLSDIARGNVYYLGQMFVDVDNTNDFCSGSADVT